MSKIYISELGSPKLIEYLIEQGHQIFIIVRDTTACFGNSYVEADNNICTPAINFSVLSGKSTNLPIECLKPAGNVAFSISCHPDILYCQLTKDKVFHGKKSKLGKKYPKDIIYNGCSTGKYFIHNLKYTDPLLLEEVERLGLKKVSVHQGYAKCSIAVVDENSIITYDSGIAASCANQAPQLNVLLIRPGHILLPGYNTGFIGGACGRIGSDLIFNGNLSAHPDFLKIKEFIENRGFKCIWFEDIPLTDIGSIIEEA